MIVATNNQGKIKEIKEILEDEDIYSLKDLNINVDVVEDATTFLGNAYKKAKEIYEMFHEIVLADDSGLCINSLNGFPGVATHRFLGEDATDRERNLTLIEKLDSTADRSAKVVCAMVYYNGEEVISVEGELLGKISTEVRGENGFGFDEIFELENGKTLAELSTFEKNQISARRMALNKLKSKLDKSSRYTK